MVRLADEDIFIPETADLGALTEDIVIDGETIDGSYVIDTDSGTFSGSQPGLEFTFEGTVRIHRSASVRTENAIQLISTGSVEETGTGLLGGIGDFFGADEETVVLEWVPANVNSVRSSVDSILLEYLTGVNINRLFDPLNEAHTHELDLALDRDPSRVTQIPFRQVRLPEVGDIRDDVEDLPNMEIDLVPRGDNAVDQLIGDLVGRDVLTLEIPPSIFIEWIDPDVEFDCLELETTFIEEVNSIVSDIDSLQSEVSGMLTSADDVMNDVSSLGGYDEDSHVIDRGDVSEAVMPEITEDDIDEETSPVTQEESDVPLLADRDSIMDVDEFRVEGEGGIISISSSGFVEDMDVGQIPDLSERDIQEWSDLVEESEDIVEAYNELLDDIENQIDIIDSGLVAEECEPELRGYLRESLGDMPELQSSVAVLDAFSTDYEFLTRLDMELLDTRLDVPDSLLNQVEQFKSAVEAVDPPVMDERVQDLVSEGEDAIDAIESELDPEHPQRGELISDVRDAMSVAEGLSTFEREDVPCEELYPEIDSRLEDIEVTVSRIERAGVEPDGTILEPVEGYGSIDELVSDIEDVGDDVNQVVEDQRCVNQFRDRIDSLVSQAEARMTGIRVDEDAMEEIEQRREDLLERVEGRLEDVDTEIDGPFQ